MAIEPVRNDADHRAALSRIEALWDAAEGSPEAAELDALATLVEHYEDKRWPVAVVEPLSALTFAMEQQGLAQADLAALLGSRSRASEILSGKRALTLDQIRLIAHHWHVPVSLLVGRLEVA
jgi:HTH-type transcriptional regulator / antitoxin HigA